jgi:hypothetical protein
VCVRGWMCVHGCGCVFLFEKQSCRVIKIPDKNISLNVRQSLKEGAWGSEKIYGVFNSCNYFAF